MSKNKQLPIITVETSIPLPVIKVWEVWTKPEHIVMWNHASDDWKCPKAENDIRVGGKFSYTMSANDGSVSFDFEGKYVTVKKFELIVYTINDGRHVRVQFTSLQNSTIITETFEAEGTHSEKQQREGWQAILDNFKKYVESGKSTTQ